MIVNAVGTEQHGVELTELAAHIRACEISLEAVTLAQLERIASMNATLGNYALVMADVAIAQAAWHRRRPID